MQRRPTILVPVFDGTITRNLFRTDVIKVLKMSGVRVVILPPPGKAEFYEREFGDGDLVMVEHERVWQHDRLEFVMNGLFMHSIPTNFMRIRQRDWYLPKKQYARYALASALRFLGRFSFWHVFIRWLDARMPVPPYINRVFDKWDPDMVFAPTMNSRDEVAFMRLARRRGKKTIGMFKSWDNPTSKAFLRFFPDSIICHTEIMREETFELYGYPKDKVIVTGVPQFDIYFGLTPTPREKFCNTYNIDPDSKIILYAAAGDWMTANDKSIVEGLLAAVDKGTFGNATVLLRLHPAYESATESLQHPRLVVDRPGHLVTGRNVPLNVFEFRDTDMLHLADSLQHCAVFVNTASTLIIEAAIMDRPIISIAFDGDENLSYWRSVARYYDREHMLSPVRSKGVALPRSSSEFIAAIRTYIDDPRREHTGREKIVEDQCVWTDGKSGERVGTFLAKTVRT